MSTFAEDARSLTLVIDAPDVGVDDYRHAIAHTGQGRVAGSSETYSRASPVVRERTPAGYLRSQSARSKRFQTISRQMIVIASKLK